MDAKSVREEYRLTSSFFTDRSLTYDRSRSALADNG
jgi:hypothetical protein